jgi:PII-like signaling protein
MSETVGRKFLVIICESESCDAVVRRIQDAGVTHYTVQRGATGCGETGRHEGTPVWPGDCVIVFSCVLEEQVGPVLEQLSALHNSRPSHSLGLKVFSLPARELL